jgi:hypothetical protein
MPTHDRWQPIRPPAAGARPVTLDTAYGRTLVGAAITGRFLRTIDAYSDADAAEKDRFLAEARRYLRATGQALQALGFTEQQIAVNRGGIAVSGEVYAAFRHGAHMRWVFCWIESTSCRFLTPGRDDGVLTTARWRESAGQSVREGENVQLSANLDSPTLATRLAAILGVTADTLPVPACPAPAQLPLYI